MHGVMEHGLLRLARRGVDRDVEAGIGIRIRERKTAARHLETNAVSGQEGVADMAQANSELEGFSRRQQLRLIESVAVARPLDSAHMGQAHGTSVRMDVEQLGGEIRVQSIARGVQQQLDGADDGERRLHRLAAVDQDVGAPFDLAMILRARLVRDRVERIVAIAIGRSVRTLFTQAAAA